MSTLAPVVHTVPGHTATLDCTFISYPAVSEVRWQRQLHSLHDNHAGDTGVVEDVSPADNIWVEQSADYNGTSVLNYRLNISPVSDVDLGTYTCTGSNSLGQASQHFVLTGTATLVLKHSATNAQ